MNTDGKMSFKDFIFPVNPSFIRVSSSRKLEKKEIPFNNNVVYDMGGNGKVIKGEGEFYGENCLQTFSALKNVFESGGGGMLYIPSEKPLYAVFSSLELIADDNEGIVKYSFEFAESFEKFVDENFISCFGNGVDSLWDFAYKYNKSVERLIALNPFVRRPYDAIEKGVNVKLC